MARTSGTRPKGNGPGIGGPANGDGWGGGRKGEHRDPAPAARPFDGSEPLQGAALANSDPDKQAARAVARADAAGLKAEMRQVLAEIARDKKAPPQARAGAADKLLDRLEGKPVQPTITASVDDVSRITDADLAAELARLSGAAASAAAGDAGTAMPGELGDVVR